MPSPIRVEQRWYVRPAREGSYTYAWCLVQDDKAFPFGEDPLEVFVYAEEHAGKDLHAEDLWYDPELSRRSPIGTDEEDWLRHHDTRHPNYVAEENKSA